MGALESESASVRGRGRDRAAVHPRRALVDAQLRETMLGDDASSVREAAVRAAEARDGRAGLRCDRGVDPH